MLSWVLLLHLLGFAMWVGGLLAVTGSLSRAGSLDAPARTGLIEGAARIERWVALPGFLLALGLGLYMLITNATGHTPLRQGWMHIKLTLVLVGMLPVQGLVGARRKKLREGGDAAALGRFFGILFWVVLALAIGILFLVQMKPMNRVFLPM